MAILTSPSNSNFDCLSQGSGTLVAHSGDSITVSFILPGSKLPQNLKLFGSFDSQGNINALTSGTYNLPDASVVTLLFPSSIDRISLEFSGETLRVDQLFQSLFAGDDWITLGDLPDKLAAGDGDDYIDGNGGADRIRGDGGNDFIAGGAGIDTAEYAGSRMRFSISGTAGTFSVSDQGGTEGTDTLSSVERLQFADVRVALDLDGNAGQVAKLLGAVFGVKAVANREYMGIGLSLIDGGMSYSALGEVAVAATGKTMPVDVVTLLWTNVVGSAPTAQDAQPFIELLLGGMSAGQLASIAADTLINEINIDLVGLVKSGVEFVPTA